MNLRQPCFGYAACDCASGPTRAPATKKNNRSFAGRLLGALIMAPVHLHRLRELRARTIHEGLLSDARQHDCEGQT